jgi:hypothetical protein
MMPNRAFTMQRDRGLRWLPVLFVFMSFACAQSPSPDAGQATDFIIELEKDEAYRVGLNDAVERKITAKQLDKKVLLRGAIELLQTGGRVGGSDVAQFLGRLGDPSAIAPLVKAFDQANEGLRETICYALRRLNAKGEPTESALVKLRRSDPSCDVRVAAALALGRLADSDAVAAFDVALGSTKNDWVRNLSEEQLEKAGELRLPLPEQIYKEIDAKEYEELKAHLFRKVIRREIKKGDTLFFELVEKHVDGVPDFYYWYRVKVK